MNRTYTLSLQSRFEEVEKVPVFVEEISRDMGLNEELTGNVMLAVSEAVTNSIVHGNEENIGKYVSLRVVVDTTSITIEVEDEGKGFDPEKTPDPTKQENLMDEGGRGLFLMEKVSDEINYSNGGRLITMKFYR